MTTFSPSLIEAFRDYSRDQNPLHVDAQYARRTPFGEVVVFGMAAVVKGLFHWARGRCFSLTSIQGEFRRPLFQNLAYDLQITEEGSKVKIAYLKGGAIQAKFSFEWRESSPFPDVRSDAAGFYEPHSPSRQAFERAFGISPGQIPAFELHALLWSSFSVGMEYPGRQALYASFDFRFDSDPASSASQPLELRNVKREYDERFGQATITGTGRGVSEFSIRAFRRPEAVEYPIADVERAVGRSSRWAGKSVFIAGGSRGFGAVLAKAFAVQGASITIGYARSEYDAGVVAQEIRDFGGKVQLLRGDLAETATYQALTAPQDIVVLNASPAIRAEGFLEMGADPWRKFVTDSLDLVTAPLSRILPQMVPGATVIAISSVYAAAAEPRFSHYIAAKSAVEGLVRGLAREFRGLHFYIARPPKMLTDQTNTPGLPGQLRSATDIARDLLEGLAPVPTAGEPQEIDFHEDP